MSARGQKSAGSCALGRTHVEHAAAEDEEDDAGARDGEDVAALEDAHGVGHVGAAAVRAVAEHREQRDVGHAARAPVAEREDAKRGHDDVEGVHHDGEVDERLRVRELRLAREHLQGVGVGGAEG